MDEFIMVKVMNEAMKKLLIDKGEDTKKNNKIEELLQDEAFFYKINKEKAYVILNCVGIRNKELEKVYNKLVCPYVYYRLVRENKLKIDDPNIIIKFK